MATEENCKKILMVRLWADPKLKAGLQNWSQKSTEHKAVRCEKKIIVTEGAMLMSV